MGEVAQLRASEAAIEQPVLWEISCQRLPKPNTRASYKNDPPLFGRILRITTFKSGDFLLPLFGPQDRLR